MKTALLVLFFLPFALCTGPEVVLDTEGHPVMPFKPYLIRDATNYSLAISLDQIETQTCSDSVVLAVDPKQVIFHIEKNEAKNIMTEEPLDVEFSWTPECAKPSRWRVQVNASAVYPTLVGPPNNHTISGRFQIKKDQIDGGAYNLVFKLYDIDEHTLATQTYNNGEDLLVLKRSSKEALKVKFYRLAGPKDYVQPM